MKRLHLVALATLVLLSAHSLFAQTKPAPEAGEKVERFEVVGNHSVASDTIRVYLGVTPGEPYDPQALQRNFLNLWQTGLFDDVKIDAERGTTGVLIRVTIAERPRIGAVEYRGNKALTLTKITEALDRDKIDLHIGNTIEQTLVRRAGESIRQAYVEGGFEGVSVEASFESMTEPGEQKIIFQINEGIKAKISSIDFVGNQRFSDRRLRSVMKAIKKHGLISWVRKKNIYVPSKLEEDLERVKNLYLDHGYKDVEFGDPQVVGTSRTGRNWRGKAVQKQSVKVVIPIKEGTVHQFGKITAAGNTVFTEEQLIGKWPLKEGQTLSRKPIAGRVELFQELYQRRGYIYAFIDTEYREQENNVVDVHLQVFEGDQFRLGRLEFEGNSVTKDKVLRREIFIDEGGIMDMETFKASMYKLGQLGYFKVTENPDFKVNQQEKTVDITVKGKEEGKNDIQFGGGYSEAYGLFAQFQFSTHNFLGEGETVGVSFQRGRSQNFFSLSYSDPWFLDRPHSFGVSVFDRETELPASVGFESRGKGGSVAYGFRLDRFESVSFLYGLEDREEHTQFVPQPDSEGNVPLPEITDEQFITSAFVPAYRFDSRDNPFDTMQGSRANLSLSYSGGPLGGNINLIKPVVNYSVFRRMSRRTALSFNVEAGQIFPQDDADCAHLFSELNRNVTRLCVPRSERFFVGGDYSVRGFTSHSLGPKETFQGLQRNVGGYKYSVFNVEWVYRINDPLRFVVYADAGNAYGFKEDWDLSKLRYSTGAELRVFLPVFQFPLRFIYAFNPDPHDDDNFKAFQFSIGNTF